MSKVLLTSYPLTLSVPLAEKAQDTRPQTIRDKVFESVTLGSLALSYCDVYDLTNLHMTSHALKRLAPKAYKSTLSNIKKTKRLWLTQNSQASGLPLTKLIDMMIRLEDLDLRLESRDNLKMIFQ